MLMEIGLDTPPERTTTLTLCLPDEEALVHFGDPPPGAEVVAWNGLGEVPEAARRTQLWVPSKELATRHAKLAALAQFDELRVVQLQSAGADGWIDLVDDDQTLCDASGVHGSPTSEWVVGAVLAMLKGFPEFANNQLEGRWHRPGTVDELAGKRVLVVGAGDIGTEIRRRLLSFDADVRLVARTRREGVSATEELPQLLREADIVVLAVPLTPATRGMVDAAFLAAMPDGALLVNASRGQVVRTDDLVAAVRARHIRVALDVTDPEPLPADHSLWGAEGVFITPHVGGYVSGFPPRMYRLVADQVGRLMHGRPLRNVVRDGY
jgi:phosphoglycerate dehydrogenase-like enzyme